MNILFEEVDQDGQLTIHGELDGFKHNVIIGAEVAKDLSIEQLRDLADFTMREAYDRFISEQP